jgi:succinylglutamate desuccinylase
MLSIKALLLLVFVLPLTSHSLASASSSNRMPVRSVVIVGGTHGNEYTGVWCIKELERPSVFKAVSKRYPSLAISTLMGNPTAHLANKRFMDTDLNREFTAKKLQAIKEALEESHGQAGKFPAESVRALEISQLLGPKSDPATDVVVDLHSTTTNMGVTIIIPENDFLMAQAAAYVLHKCQENPIQSIPNSGPTKISEEARIIMHSIPDRNDRPNLSSVGKHGFTIEIGPVPQGIVRHDAVEKTKQALEAFLEFLELHNVDASGSDPEAKGVLKQLQEWYPTGRVPCYRSAVATKPSEMSGKIRWPCSDHNPNFPAYMVHKSVQDQDFKLLRTGDPLFVTMDGDVIPYDGSHGDSVFLIFINEGGYYYPSSGTGIGVAVNTEFDLETADFIDLEELCLVSSDTEDCSLE